VSGAGRDGADAQPPLLVLPEPDELLLAVSLELPLEPEEPLLDADGVELLLLEGWSLEELLELEGELELGVEDDDELPLLSFLFIARLPVDELDEPEGLVDGEDDAMPDEPDEPDGPDWDRRESLPRSQAESPKVAAIAAATAVRKNRFCSMSAIS
jgi:hypothetical protein